MTVDGVVGRLVMTRTIGFNMFFVHAQLLGGTRCVHRKPDTVRATRIIDGAATWRAERERNKGGKDDHLISFNWGG